MLSVLIILSGCSTREEPVNETDLNKPILLPASMKGYELYSWKESGHWHFTLITGTNRNKTPEEIIADANVEQTDWIKITVAEADNLRVLLNRMPAGQNISWISQPTRVPGFSMPSAMVVSQIKNVCDQRDLHLQLIK